MTTMTTQWQVPEAGDLSPVVEAILAVVRPRVVHGAAVVTLEGDLGAGKTALVKAIATALGVTETVQSPTFVIMRRYDTVDRDITTLLHMDAYRIESVAELLPLQVEKIYTTPQTLFCIEWASLIKTAVPTPTVAVSITEDAQGTRTFTLTTHG